MRTVSTENRQKFGVLVLHELFGLECVCAIRGSLHAVVLEGKMSYSGGSVIDTHFGGGGTLCIVLKAYCAYSAINNRNCFFPFIFGCRMMQSGYFHPTSAQKQ